MRIQRNCLDTGLGCIGMPTFLVDHFADATEPMFRLFGAFFLFALPWMSSWYCFTVSAFRPENTSCGHFNSSEVESKREEYGRAENYCDEHGKG